MNVSFKGFANNVDSLSLRLDRTFAKWKPKFKTSDSQGFLSEFQIAFGFTKATSAGSSHFNNIFGRFIEDVFGCSVHYTNLPQKGNYGGSNGIDVKNKTLFEVKSRYNTMKGSETYSEISKKLQWAISHNFKFSLLIVTGKDNASRDVPLHEASRLGVSGLGKISQLSGYDPAKHRCKSGERVWKDVFRKNAYFAKCKVLSLLHSIRLPA